MALKIVVLDKGFKLVNVNEATGTGLNFSFTGDNSAIALNPVDLASLLKSLSDDKTEAAMNKLLRESCGVSAEIKYKEFGAEEK